MKLLAYFFRCFHACIVIFRIRSICTPVPAWSRYARFTTACVKVELVNFALPGHLRTSVNAYILKATILVGPRFLYFAFFTIELHILDIFCILHFALPVWRKRRQIEDREL